MEAFKRLLKRIGVAIVVALVAVYIVVLMYALPHTVVVKITGTEVKRGIGGVGGDVRYVLAEDREGNPKVFRNEDTGWGFPPYFKFDSGTVAAEANSLAKKEDATSVLVRYYGFRMPVISAFPNVVSLKRVADDYEHVPLFNTVFLIGNTVLFGFLTIKILLWKRRRRRQSKEVAEAA